MENKLAKIWKKEGKSFKKPSFLYAVDSEGKKYFIYRDDSSIVFVIVENSEVTYIIPKKYLKIISEGNNSYYKVLNIEKFSIVSCIGKKSPVERFIIDKIVNNQDLKQ
jgi:hypothetical protein